MAVHKCGWCGNTTHMTVFGSGQIRNGGQKRYFIETAFQCDTCLRLSVGSAERDGHPGNPDNATLVKYWAIDDPDTWAPSYVEGQSFSDVPAHIADAAGEAHKSRSINNLKSSILMARTVIEAVAKHKGITSGSLYNKIDALATQGVIQDFTKQTAHAIRTFGNDMAHGDIELAVDVVDAEMVLEFMDALLSEVFQNPAKLAALQARVAARAGNSNP